MSDGPSEHLSWAELACHDPQHTEYPLAWRDSRALLLGAEFERIRAACGHRAIQILSGYRTSDWNRVVGGAVQSQHVEGRALDLRHPTLSIDAFYKIIWQLATGDPTCSVRGLAKYPNFIHIDVRPATQLVVWRGGRPQAEMGVNA